jgi:hypothetical protein
VFRSILGESALPFRNDLKPSPSFILDFMNFWPRWHQRVRQVIEMEIAESDRIEATFESEYTFAAKILSNLRLNDRIQRFCASIFEPVLVELEMIKEELVVDFSGIYEKWSEQLPKLPVLKRFLDGGEGESRTARGEIEQIFGKLKGEQ